MKYDNFNSPVNEKEDLKHTRALNVIATALLILILVITVIFGGNLLGFIIVPVCMSFVIWYAYIKAFCEMSSNIVKNNKYMEMLVNNSFNNQKYYGSILAECHKSNSINAEYIQQKYNQQNDNTAQSVYNAEPPQQENQQY